MKVVALISGGKDSIYNIMKCIDHGHDVVCLANLYPVDPEVDDLDSYMYQTVGHQNIRALAHCLGLPLLRQPLHGGSKNLDLHYTPTECDEVEDLYQLLCRVKQRFPAVTAVASGAILSTYQRLRVENVCERLGLFSLAYLWQRDQRELLQEMVARDLRPMIVKVASMGLGRRHLGRTINDVLEELLAMEHIHVCGEGGEFETFVIGCPLFERPMRLLRGAAVMVDDNKFAPVGVWQFECVAEGVDSPAEDADDPPVEVVGLGPPPPAAPAPVAYAPDAPDFADVAGTLMMGGLCTESVLPPGSAELGVAEQVHALLQFTRCRLAERGLSMDRVFYMHLYCRSMGDFALINAAYNTYFGREPPARATVEMAGLASAIVMEVYVRCPVAGTEADPPPFESLHVQSISEWAPACVGPYSQAYRVGGAVFFAGIIGLVPETMALPAGGGAAEGSLALRSLERVADVMRTACARAAMVIVYVTDWAAAAERVAQWRAAAGPGWAGLLRVVQVTALPRGCSVEFQMIARTGDEGEEEAGGPVPATCDGAVRGRAGVRVLGSQAVQVHSAGLVLGHWAFEVASEGAGEAQVDEAVRVVTEGMGRQVASWRWYVAAACPNQIGAGDVRQSLAQRPQEAGTADPSVTVLTVGAVTVPPAPTASWVVEAVATSAP